MVGCYLLCEQDAYFSAPPSPLSPGEPRDTALCSISVWCQLYRVSHPFTPALTPLHSTVDPRAPRHRGIGCWIRGCFLATFVSKVTPKIVPLLHILHLICLYQPANLLIFNYAPCTTSMKADLKTKRFSPFPNFTRVNPILRFDDDRLMFHLLTHQRRLGRERRIRDGMDGLGIVDAWMWHQSLLIFNISLLHFTFQEQIHRLPIDQSENGDLVLHRIPLLHREVRSFVALDADAVAPVSLARSALYSVVVSRWVKFQRRRQTLIEAPTATRCNGDGWRGAEINNEGTQK